MTDVIKTAKQNFHRPIHIYSGHTYFLTGRMMYGKSYMKEETKKSIFVKKLGELSKEMGLSIYSYVVLDNHYHLLFSLNIKKGVTNASSLCERGMDELAFVIPLDLRSQKLAKFVRRLHAITSKELNKIDNTKGRKIWYQYYDRCVRNEKDFFMRFNYILKNPFKHSLVSNLNESYAYKYSSNFLWLSKLGQKGLDEGLIKYPVAEVCE